jgi:hypothetical protein
MDTTNLGDIQELGTLEAFQAAMADKGAFLVVTDRSTPTRIHRTTCQAVLQNHFVTKVISNGAKRGRYYKSPTYAMAATRFASKPCGVCRPDVP